jgi:hypothetical protein
VSAVYRLPRGVLDETFTYFRRCGAGRRECQTLWIGPWATPDLITEAVHPKHEAHVGGFELDDSWLSDFWLRLADENFGIRIQVHTHPAEAFHSRIDDEFPIIHTPGFLSLVIPDFALGPVGFDDAYLAEIQSDGRWRQIPIAERLVVE